MYNHNKAKTVCIFLGIYCNDYTYIYTWSDGSENIQYIPRNMHTVFALLCFVVVIHWLIFSYPSGLLHWHCGNLTIAPVPAKQPWWIWINTSCEFIMNDCITTTKQSTTKPCAYFLGYTVLSRITFCNRMCMETITPLNLWPSKFIHTCSIHSKIYVDATGDKSLDHSEFTIKLTKNQTTKWK